MPTILRPVNLHAACGNLPGMTDDNSIGSLVAAFGRESRWRVTGLLLCAIALDGCGAGSGEGLDIAGRPLAEGGDVPLAATLESIQVNVFDASCIDCHAGAAAPLGLRLDAPNSYTNLVGVPSQQNSSLLRVDPGKPDSSYLVQKLEGTASEGGRMPLGGPSVPDSTIAFVRQWIADGALPTETGELDGPPVVVSMEPPPSSILRSLPAEIVVGFDREIDASTINLFTFLLDRSVDGVFGNGDDLALSPASVAASPANSRVAIVDIGSIDPAEDTYRLTVTGSGPNIVLSVAGVALDGEFAGSFPSGDGVEGGDFVATFSVEGVQATLESIQANVFTPSCAVAGCHTGPAGPSLPAGMDLSSADASFANLVGVDSQQSAGDVRVVAGVADASYLVRKLEGTAAVGGRMPIGAAALDATTIAAIRAWIDAGAER